MGHSARKLLEQYARREGHTWVPNRHREGSFSLARWVVNQRTYYRNGQLSDERAKRLQRLPSWTWDPLAAGWEEGFERLGDYIARERTARVPVAFRDNGFPRGEWVSVQRKAFKEHKLSPKRQERLERLATWTWNVRDELWPEGLARLEQFVAREGHARVPTGHIEPDGFRLGQWVANRRAERPQLSTKRQATLESLPGWTWSVKQTRWEEAYAQLQGFARREGHARVPNAYAEGELPLGRWVSIQRQTYREGGMSAERQRKLQAVPGWTWSVFQRRR
jgi:Helicase associated domain